MHERIEKLKYSSKDDPRYRLWIEDNLYHCYDRDTRILYTSERLSDYLKWQKQAEQWYEIIKVLPNDKT